jgi:hypothetical protein
VTSVQLVRKGDRMGSLGFYSVCPGSSPNCKGGRKMNSPPVSYRSVSPTPWRIAQQPRVPNVRRSYASGDRTRFVFHGRIDPKSFSENSLRFQRGRCHETRTLCWCVRATWISVLWQGLSKQPESIATTIRSMMRCRLGRMETVRVRASWQDHAQPIENTWVLLRNMECFPPRPTNIRQNGP